MHDEVFCTRVKLRKKAIGWTDRDIAPKVGLSVGNFTRKINGFAPFTETEMRYINTLLCCAELEDVRGSGKSDTDTDFDGEFLVEVENTFALKCKCYIAQSRLSFSDFASSIGMTEARLDAALQSRSIPLKALVKLSKLQGRG